MDLKEYVINNVNPEQYYKSVFPKWSPSNRANMPCFWHEDKNPSLAVGLKNGGAKCHACEKSIGNIVHFESEKSNLPEKKAALKIYETFVRKIIPKPYLASLQKQLNGTQTKLIKKDMGLSPSYIQNFGLGYDTISKRITIPIQDQWGNTTNLRYYSLPSLRTQDTKVKIYNHTVKDEDGSIKESFGYLELFPWSHIKDYTPQEPVFMMKAEKDTMLAISMGLQAFCVTNGELAWSEGWDELFENYEIGICLDKDKTGIAATEKKLAILQKCCKFVADISLPLKQGSKDFADWILSDHGTKAKFLAIWQSLKPKASAAANKSLPSEVPKLPEFYSNEYQSILDIGRNSDMLNMQIKVRAIVSAKTDKTYTVPYKFIVSSGIAPKREWQIPIGRELIKLTRSDDDGIIEFIKKDLLNTPKGSHVEIVPIEYTTITEVEIIPVASVENDAPYVTQKCFFVGKHIEANVPYHLDIIPATEIRSQETIGIIVKAIPISYGIDEFVFEKETLTKLEQFKQKEGRSWDGLCKLANLIAAQFTPIRARMDWHIVALLSWASPLQFNFPNEGLQRGWMNTLCLGDTETGKSLVVQSLQKLFNCGVFVNAENCTYVGLIGGAVKLSSGQFMLRWGRIPLCNKQLVVVEELSGISITEISNMSEVRSSGIARLDKGGLSGETSSRTRLICLSNVRGCEKSLAGFNNGVKAIQELIGHGEDIARFDLICTLTAKEVPAHVINQDLYDVPHEEVLKGEDLKLLMQFIWALKPEQIEITKEAYLECLSQTQQLGRNYHPSCHIFQAASGRLKLARIACAIACIQFAWNGRKILIEPEHIQAAAQLLRLLYDKESFGYRAFSDQLFYRDNIRAEALLTETFMQLCSSPTKRSLVANYLTHASKFTRDELCQVASLQIHQADQLIGKMISSNAVDKGEANVWELNQNGYKWMQAFSTVRRVDGEEIEVKRKPVKLGPKKGLAAILCRK